MMKQKLKKFGSNDASTMIRYMPRSASLSQRPARNAIAFAAALEILG
jgi:hypothetical protein